MNMEDKEFMGKYISNNPFEFKQGIISHCREMDKIDVYNWVAEDELKIDKLQQENKQLKIQISAREEVCNRLESNWNELKEWVKMEHREDAIVINLTWKHATGKFLDKMQELEGSDSNE